MSLAVISPCFYPDASPAYHMVASARLHGMQPILYGTGSHIYSAHGGDEQGPLAIEAIRQRTEDIILMTDCRDVLFLAGEDEIVEKFKSFNSGMVMSAERQLHPHLEELIPLSDIPGFHRNLNIGLWIGYRDYAIDCLQRSIDLYRNRDVDPENNLDSPQAWMARGLVHGTIDFALDRNCVLFQSIMGTDNCRKWHKKRFINTVTNTEPVALHFNGFGADQSLKVQFYEQFVNVA